MKLLLHTCCAPCLIYPLKALKEEGFEVEAYFYNPNIHPQDEYLKRESACFQLASTINLKLIASEYNQEDFYKAITNKSRPERCFSCWRLRLFKTAEFAKKNNFGSFTTTLLVSIYQDINVIGDIGKKIGNLFGLSFVFRDFRPGFRQAHDDAKRKGLYCQRYCGCSYSLEERNSALSEKGSKR